MKTFEQKLKEYENRKQFKEEKKFQIGLEQAEIFKRGLISIINNRYVQILGISDPDSDLQVGGQLVDEVSGTVYVIISKCLPLIRRWSLKLDKGNLYFSEIDLGKALFDAKLLTEASIKKDRKLRRRVNGKREIVWALDGVSLGLVMDKQLAPETF